MAKTIDVKVPDIGNYRDVPVIEVLVKNGERVAQDQPLLVLESDKATMEVPAPRAGTVAGLALKAGAKVSEGDLICQLETGEASAAEPPPAAPKSTAPAAPAKAAPAPSPSAPAAAPRPAGAAPQPSLFETPSPASAGATIEVKVPDIGNYSGVPVIEVLVKAGDSVTQDAPLVVLESDKATMEVPSPAAGTVQALRLKVGDKVSQGDVVCTLATQAAAPAQLMPPPAPPRSAEARHALGPAVEDRATKTGPTPAPTPPQQPQPRSGGAVYAGPATRKFARELGVDLAQVPASGPRGRIVVEDVQAFVKARMARPASEARGAGPGAAGIPPIPAVDFAQFGPVETRPLARIRKLSAAHLHRSWLNVPHVTQFDQADITELEAFRKREAEGASVKLTLLPFLMKAVSVALRQYPEFNASLAPDGESLVMKQYCHIGFAADTEHGLVVPVVRDVWSKGIHQLAAECAELAKKARDGKLKADEMKGGSFSISSLGGIGGSHFTPIVNAPEVAILGVSRAQLQPVWDGSAFAPRLMLPLSLSYDHRVIDGAYAARFITTLARLLADLRRLLL